MKKLIATTAAVAMFGATMAAPMQSEARTRSIVKYGAIGLGALALSQAVQPSYGYGGGYYPTSSYYGGYYPTSSYSYGGYYPSSSYSYGGYYPSSSYSYGGYYPTSSYGYSSSGSGYGYPGYSSYYYW